MGAGQSTASHAHPPSRALHVLRVTPSSPASQTNIEPFFDFIVGFEGDSLSARKTIDAAELERIVESHEGKNLNLLVWNSKNEATRVVSITPSRAWSLPHSVPNPREPEAEPQPSLLGLSMRMCEPEFSIDNVWHVLDVLEGSPAESAGLVPYGDWIIGWFGGVLSAEGDFYDVVEAHVDKPLRVYVYSYDFDTIREVVLVPNRQWGGEGLLGCVFGFGLLHRIPAVTEERQPGALPQELHDSNTPEEQTLFVPADTADNHMHESYSAHESGEPFMSGLTSPKLHDYGYRFSTRGAAPPQGNGSHHAPAYTIHEEDDHDRRHDSISPLPESHAEDGRSSPRSDSSHASHSNHCTSTPGSPRPLGAYSNGVPYAGVRSRSSLIGLGNLHTVLNGNGRAEEGEGERDEGRPSFDETEGSEATSESLTSVE